MPRKKAKELSQLQRANELLLQLRDSVTADDRKQAMRDFGHSKHLIILYLSGKGPNLDTAIDLLEFFRAKIEWREKLLA